MTTRRAFLAAVLALLMSLPPAQGQGASPVATPSEEHISSEEAALTALWALEDGGTLKLGMPEVRLNATLEIAASHIVIAGAPLMTHVYCPPGSSAFVVSGTNVSLSGLIFSHCQNASAVRIPGDPGALVETNIGDFDSDARKEEPREKIVQVKDCLFQQNKASRGAAIDADQCRLEIESSTFELNEAIGSGGAVHVTGGELSVKNSTFRNCGVKNGDGGAIRAATVRRLSVSRSLFTGNSAMSATGLGGGLVAERCGRVTVTASTFSANRGGYYGGGLYAHEGRNVTVSESTFAKNSAGDGGGGICANHSAHAAVITSTFSENSADFYGGGVCAPFSTVVTVEQSFFSQNQANLLGGGVFTHHAANVSVKASTFLQNSAVLYGGGVYAANVTNVTVWNSSLEGNLASAGGALYIRFSALKIHDSYVMDNVAAEAGGGISVIEKGRLISSNTVLANNRALLGGGISLSDDSALEQCEECMETLLQGNIAFRGGGVYCPGCRVTTHTELRVVENVAAEFGGGIYAEYSPAFSIQHSRFVRNVASFGGGVALRNDVDVELTQCRFEENIAVEGGGLHLSSENGHFEKYDMTFSSFERNQALSLNQMEVISHRPAVSRWLTERIKTLASGKRDWLRRKECYQGRGGGAFFSFRNQREDSSIAVFVWLISVQGNSALVGGGIYLDNHNVFNNGVKECPRYGFVQEPCFDLTIGGGRLVDNTASVAGGGLFVNALNSRGMIFGVLDGSHALRKCEDETEFFDGFCYLNNRVLSLEGEGYGPQIATLATSLEFLNVDGPLIGLNGRDRLSVLKKSYEGNSVAREEIRLMLKDAFGRKISGKTVDSEMVFVLRSKWISGRQEYRAVNGIIAINETYMAGYDISDILIVDSGDGKALNATVEFSTLPCPNGELPTEPKTDCFRCSAQSYAFSATGDACQPCEEHANCAGTAQLVPDDGYWHSTPFSPFIRRCPLKEACSFDGRGKALAQYYSTSSEIYSKLDRYNTSKTLNSGHSSEDYQQCAEGYRGILCGACDEGYGHSSGGECKPCSGSLTAAGFLAGVSAVMLFLVLTIKVALGADGVRKHVSSIYKEQRREARMAAQQVLQRWMSTTPSLTQQETQQEGSPSTVNDDTADPAAEPTNPHVDSIPERSEDQGTTTGSDGNKPLLQRTTSKIEDPFEDDHAEEQNASSAKLSVASEMLVATYNILFNYVQLSSFAFPLNVDWNVALEALFSIYGRLGRVMQIEFLPLDCSFGDREGDIGTPNSITVLWYRVCFPAMAVAAYMLIVLSLKFVWGRQRRSRNSGDLVPSLRLICLLVYLAYSIDIFSDLLRVMGCQDLSFAKGTRFYEAFEVKDLGVVWTEDTAVLCWDGAHLVSTVLAAFGLSLCLGVLVFMVVVLVKGAKEGRLADPSFVRRFGVLYLGYRMEGLALYWESVLTVRRMLLAALQVYGSHRETTGVQIGLMAIVIFASLAIHTIVLPFEEADAQDTFPLYAGSELGLVLSEDVRKRWVDFNRAVKLNGLEAASLFMSLSLFMVAGCICDDKANDVEANLLITACFFLNVIYFLFMLYRIWYGFHNYLDAIADEKNLKFTDAVDTERDRETWLHIKAWKLWQSRSESNDAEPSAPQNA